MGCNFIVATMVRFHFFGVILFIIFSASSMGQTASSGGYQDYVSSPETCSNDSKTWIVNDTESATILAEAVNCYGGRFNATWRGSVLVERTIIIPEGTTLNVTGEGSGAEINGDGKTRLFKAEGATLHMTNLTLKNGNSTISGGALYAYYSTVSWGGVTSFANNTASDDGGALYAYGSNVSWDGVTTFVDNTAGSWGGALRAEDSNIYWNGVTMFDENTAQYGGALYAYYSTVFWDGETAFVNNTADYYGGGLRGISGSTVWWDGVTSFLDNRAEYGGAMAVSDATINILWAGITSYTANIATSSGGAIYATYGCDINIQGDSNFTENDAAIDGGAVYVSVDDDYSTSYFVFENNPDVLFQGNTCGGDGGALAFIGEVDTSFSLNMTFRENTAGVAGGAIYMSEVTGGIRFEGTRFISNSAVIGGGLYCTGGGTAGTEDGDETSRLSSTTLIGCEFIGNEATRTGGAMDSSGGVDTIVDTSFKQNTAIIGGALSLLGTSSLSGCEFIENLAYEDGGPAISNDGLITDFSNCSFVDNAFNCEEGNYLEFDNTDTRLDNSCAGCSIDCTSCKFGGKRPTKCVEALEHTNATGVDARLESLSIDPGYWRATNTSVNIFACYNYKACLGGETGEDGYCLEGYEGPYCSVCSKDYTSSFGFTCNKCSDNTAGSIALAVILAFGVLSVFVVLVLHLISGRMGGTDKGFVSRVARFVPLHSIKIVIVVWQIITQFSTVANVVFPSVYQTFLDGVDILNFDLSWVLSTGCMIDTDFHDQLLLATMGPLVCIFILGGTYIAAMRRNLASAEALGIVRRKHVSMVLLLTFLVYSSVSSTLFKTFACEKLDDGKTYLRADYRIECTSSKHNVLEFYAGFMVILYVVGIPVFYVVLLYHNREALVKIKHREEDGSIKPITDLWKPYRPDRFYYEVVECIRRVLLTGALVYIYPNTAAQIAAAIMIATFFMIVSEALAPHSSQWDTWINRTGHAIVFTSMFLALLLKVDVTGEHASSETAFESVLVAAHSVLVLVVVIQAVVLVLTLRKEVKEYPIPRMRLGYSRSVCKGGVFLEDEAPPSYEDELEHKEKSHPNQVMGQSQTAANKDIDVSRRGGEGQC